MLRMTQSEARRRKPSSCKIRDTMLARSVPRDFRLGSNSRGSAPTQTPLPEQTLPERSIARGVR
ncbi:MAG TPA: hypothetical protein VG963_30075, partial [Polyangiaceae bacterium]|nr:hypothetical protein [Polyangiaceae bacterium]